MKKLTSTYDPSYVFDLKSTQMALHVLSSKAGLVTEYDLHSPYKISLKLLQDWGFRDVEEKVGIINLLCQLAENEPSNHVKMFAYILTMYVDWCVYQYNLGKLAPDIIATEEELKANKNIIKDMSINVKDFGEHKPETDKSKLN